MNDWLNSNELFGLEYTNPEMTNAHFWLFCAVMWGMAMLAVTTACALTGNDKGVRLGSIGILLVPLAPINLLVALIVSVAYFTWVLLYVIVDAWRTK